MSHAGVIVDLFAGGGGASEGIRMALGRDPDVAVNHDRVAIAMHEANHPGTRHLRQDVWQVPPRWATKGQPVGLLWASPDCTHFSKAKGSAPRRDERRRDLAWVVEKWAREVRPRVIILENVEEFRTWGPLDKEGRIIQSQKGTTFVSFVRSLRRLGYSVQWRDLNACDFGAPTTRRRLFMIARCDGLPIFWPDSTHGPGTPRPFRAAADIIDWSQPCPSIFGRKKPLAEATLRRIASGIKRYVLSAKEPFIVTYYGQKKAGEFRGCGMADPLPTQTTENRHALVTAFLAKHYGGVVGQAMDQPVSTITSIDHHSLVTSHLVMLRGTCRDGQDLWRPMPTVTAGGLHVGEVRAFLVKYFGTAVGQSVMDPVHTLTARDRMGLVTVTIGGEPYTVMDIGMRMLSPRELFRAQGFPDRYLIDVEIDGRQISKADQVRMCGNSVCPPIAAALVRANLAGTAASDFGSAQELLQLNMFALQ